MQYAHFRFRNNIIKYYRRVIQDNTILYYNIGAVGIILRVSYNIIL